MEGESTIRELDIKPEWLKEVLEEIPVQAKYIAIMELAKLINAEIHNFKRYICNMGIEPLKRHVMNYKGLVWCITEEQAKEVVRQRIKDGYITE